MSGIILFFLSFGIFFASSQEFASYLTLYNRRITSEATFSVTYRTQDPDTPYTKVHFDQSGYNMCFRGIWNTNVGKDFLGASGSNWISESEYCYPSLPPFPSHFKALRPVGDPDDFTRSSITFFEETMAGADHLFLQNVPTFNSSNTGLYKSLILTGPQPLTLFTKENYGGWTKCIQPQGYKNIATLVYNIESVLGIDPADIKSIKFGCFSKDIYSQKNK